MAKVKKEEQEELLEKKLWKAADKIAYLSYNLLYMQFIIIFILLSITGIAFAHEGDTLAYNKRSVLTWEDFQSSTENKNDSLRSYLSISLQMRRVKTNIWMGYGIYEAHAIAFKKASWVKDVPKDSSILKHQQYAFALAELVARKLENEVNDAKINLRWMNKINKIFSNYVQFAIQCRLAYERETQYGLNVTKQAEWEAMIDRSQIRN